MYHNRHPILPGNVDFHLLKMSLISNAEFIRFGLGFFDICAVRFLLSVFDLLIVLY